MSATMTDGQKKSSYFRPEIDEMEGYTPGEQPKDRNLIKLNTNENPYPPSPRVSKLLKQMDPEKFRLYPDPVGNELRQIIADLYGFQRGNVILGNGSDDILTIAVRSFAGQGSKIAQLEPTYSLYPVLARIQGAEIISIPLAENFELPANFAGIASKTDADLFFLARPNAPTGNVFPLDEIEELCGEFRGIVFVDEAYVDFAESNCLELLKKFDNLVISRTLSKSYSLAGIRLGFAFASENIINGMMKVKDSYNVNFLTQKIAIAALSDQDYFLEIRQEICESRTFVSEELRKLNFTVLPSEANFVFVSPPDGDGERYFKGLRENSILVRYFPGERTGAYVRITVGTCEDMQKLIDFTQKFV